ncbi:MAG: hypothetical protein IIT81_02020, partial [Mycoplasmataceae bacterium]|nr:hypothetical protein [Mycoplasmataceae bacterium]
LVGISTPITASYTVNYSQLNINSSTIYYGNNGTLSINESSFSSLIQTPYYFWQVEGSNNSWNTVSTSTSSSTYDVSNLTSSKTYRVIVANSNSLSSASIKIYSNTIVVSPTELSDLNYNIDVNNQTINPSNTYNTNQTNSNYTFSLSNIKDIAGNINNTNATGTLTWSITSVDDSKIIETKTFNLTNSSEQNWTDFTYNFSNYGTYIIEAKLAINNISSQLTKTTNFNFQINVVNFTTSYSTKNYATIWLDSQLNSWIGQQNNTTWNNFVNQYTLGYQLNASGTDFDNCVAYFQQMPANDSTGGYEFLTIQAISNKPITVNTWNGSSFELDSKINTIPAGSLFTWTLPYELNSLTVSNNQISIAMYPYSNWLNTYSGTETIATPFGLSIGTISNPTAISNDGQYTQATNGVIGIEYGYSYGSPYEAPSSLTANLTSTNIAYSDLSNSNNTITISNKQAITFKSIIDTNNTYSGSISFNVSDENNKNIGMYEYNNITNKSTNPWYTYFFYAPGKYEITFEYTINEPVSETIVQTYYVIYNEISISASTNNPLLGTSDTLSINTSKIYSTYSDSDVTYQWFRITNNTKTAIEDANSSSYIVNINNINDTYEYQLEMTLDGIVYTSNIITLSINSNINP